MIGRTARTTTARTTFVTVLVLAALAASAGPVDARAAIAWPTQSSGDRGTDVLAIQYLLRARLAGSSAALPPVDGLFRSTTDTAVRAFQVARGLPPNGIVAWATWGGLIQRLGRGASGDAVRALQVELVAKVRAPIAVSGSFGAGTEASVIAFQRHIYKIIPVVAEISMSDIINLPAHNNCPDNQYNRKYELKNNKSFTKI